MNEGWGQELVREFQIYRATSCFPKQYLEDTTTQPAVQSREEPFAKLSLNWLSNSPGRPNPQTHTTKTQ